MLMKKIIVLLLVVCFSMTITACGKNKTEYEDYNNANSLGLYNPIMESEEGYYANIDSFHLALCYYDVETKKAVYLCAKPECRHDGNDYCTATKEGVIYSGNICKNGDYIYYAAEEYYESDDTKDYKLISVKADGTEFTEVCTFQKTKGASGVYVRGGDNYGRSLAVHRGYAIVPFDDYELPTLLSDYCPNTMIINLESGKYKRLPTKDYDLTKSVYGQGDYFLYGDWLYYTITLENSGDKKTLYRYNLESEKTQVIDDLPSLFSSYAVIDGSIYYTTPKNMDTPSKLWKYNIKTKETTDISENLMISGKPLSNAEFIWNGKYFIISDVRAYINFTSLEPEFPHRVLIMNKDGNALTEYDMLNAIPSQTDENSISYELKSNNGKLYVCTQLTQDDPRFNIYEYYIDVVYCCEMDELISGNPQWYEPYDFYTLN